MRGFIIRMSDGSDEFARATRYDVEATGELVMWVEDAELGRLSPGSWISVEPFGELLSDDWPPEDLGLLIDTLSERLAAHWGYYVHELGSEEYASPMLNDLEAFVSEVFRRVGADPKSSSNRRRVEDIRRLVRAHFTEGR